MVTAIAVFEQCCARTTESLYSNAPTTAELRTVISCTLQMCIETAGRVSHCIVSARERVKVGLLQRIRSHFAHGQGKYCLRELKCVFVGDSEQYGRNVTDCAVCIGP